MKAFSIFNLNFNPELFQKIQVGGQVLEDKHSELIHNTKASRDLEKDLNSVHENLKKETTINARLENQVKSYLERKKNEDEVGWLRKKRGLVVYSEKKVN